VGTGCSTLVTEGILLFAILLKTTFVIKKSGLKAGIIHLLFLSKYNRYICRV
jgi:hypothetical protein